MKTVITEVRNAQAINLEANQFEVEINHPQFGWIPYTVGEGFRSKTLDNSAILSLIGTGFTPYTAPTQEALDADLADSVRLERDGLLLGVDAYVSNPLRWASLTSAVQALWATYRLELLYVPQQTGFPHTIEWPNKPE
tara:strand:+ start:381 stop:794 length:414 start_codon:yes stop_codon:yes gene_type:complete